MLERIGFDKQSSSVASLNDTLTNIPLEGGIVAPDKENPSTVEPETDMKKPLFSAEPPDAAVIFKPEMSN